ncbi:MAG: SDR family oxidoreductase [Bacteroidales bacterium]|nr:SDR family oxidoreductase [Bacteroidales bacterium]
MGRIVITGASSDIGFAITRRLAAFGKPLLLHCRSRADRFAALDAEVVRADFSDRKDLERFIACLDDVDILVNAAAETETGLLPQIEDDAIDRMLAVNVTALTLLCKAVIPKMCMRRHGIIVNLSSVTANRVYRGQTVYAGTKAYVETFSKGIATEYAKKGIRCNCIAPGSIQSGSLKKTLVTTGSDIIKDTNASGRLGSPDDIASAVAFLCSDESHYINGAVLHVDGGYWIGL